MPSARRCYLSSITILAFIAAVFFLGISSQAASAASSLKVTGRDWSLTIESFSDNLKTVPVLGGITSIRAKPNAEGVIISGKIIPTKSNSHMILNLDDLILITKNKETGADTADAKINGSNSVESIQRPKGVSSSFSKADFPIDITIIYLIDKSQYKSFKLKGGTPVQLTGK